MPHPPLAPGWIDRPHLRAEIGDMPLESGETMRDAFVSYVVHGDRSGSTSIRSWSRRRSAARITGSIS